MNIYSKRVSVMNLALLVAVSLMPLSALSQQQGKSGPVFEIVVTSPRVEVKETRIPMGLSSRVTMSYTVGFADLNLSTESGRGELEGRVNEAATEICLALSERYGESRAQTERCTKQAVDDAMSQVRAAIEAAEAR